jgi:prolyl oligopeptidase
MLRRHVLAAALICCLGTIFGDAQNTIPPLPSTPKHPVTDEYNGVKVADDYRWLEDGKNPDVVAWTQAQNAHAHAMLDELPIRSQIQHFLKSLDENGFPRFFALQIRGGVLFAMHSQPKQQQDTLVTLRSANDVGSAHVVLDPTKIDSSNSTSIQFYVPSQDGSKVAVSLEQGGTEAGSVHVYDVATGQPLSDVVPHVSAIGGGSVVWKGGGHVRSRQGFSADC